MPDTRLENELAAMHALRDLLQQEQLALSAANGAACEGLLASKSALIAELSALAGARHAALGRLGQRADEQGMREWIAGAPHTAQRWERLIAVTREANALNKLNGALLQQASLRTQQALQSLRPRRDSDIYGPGGQAQPASLRPARAIG